MTIDAHVHFRDEEQAYKETIKHGLKVAQDIGMSATFEMPNPKRIIDNLQRVLERWDLAKRAESAVFYGVHLGVTSDMDQVKRAIDICERSFIEPAVGLKMFAGHSVGNLGIIDISVQRSFYRTCREEKYQGVAAVHSEKESCMESKVWDPKNPISHAYARPAKAEVESVKDQIRLAEEEGFTGVLHIPHISVPEAVEEVYKAKQRGYIKITCGVTPHHITMDYTMMEREDGLLRKMNPPLREPGMNLKMLELLREGKIDWIETDHAPHTLKEKREDPYMSGIPGLPIYPLFINWLRKRGFSERQLEDLTFNNVKKAYNLERKGVNIERATRIPRLDLIEEYEFNAYKDVVEF